MAENLDPDALGVLVVTQENGNGMHHIIDGQHRAEAVRIFAGESERLPCIILPAKDPARAAELWLKINDGRAAAHPVEKHRTAVTAERERHVQTQQIINDVGYRVGTGSEDGTISAITACLKIYDAHGPEVLRSALRAIRGIWGTERDALHGRIIAGFGDFIGAYPECDMARLVDKVAKKYTAARLQGAAKMHREMMGGTLAQGVKQTLVNTYNHGLRESSRLLP